MSPETCRLCTLQECNDITTQIKIRRFIGGPIFVENETISDCFVRKDPEAPESKRRINLLKLINLTPPHLKYIAKDDGTN